MFFDNYFTTLVLFFQNPQLFVQIPIFFILFFHFIIETITGGLDFVVEGFKLLSDKANLGSHGLWVSVVTREVLQQLINLLYCFCSYIKH